MDTAYGRRWIHRIGNCEYVFSCEDLALIRRMSIHGYGVLVRMRERGDGITSIKRRRHDLSSDSVRKLMTASGHNLLKSDLEDSIGDGVTTITGRRRDNFSIY
ncbi:hypothetical protein Tco_1212288 [Tanacetum coccineum]